MGAGRSSHATASITTVRESRTVRLTTHLREISKVDSRNGRAGCRVATPSTEGQPSNTRRYAKTAITSGRARAAAGRASLNRVVLLQTIAFEDRRRTEGDGAESGCRDIEAHNALSARCPPITGDGRKRL